VVRDVQQVTLAGSRVTDGWLKHLQGMENLRILQIKRASLSDDGLLHVRQLESLRCVKLLYVPIGDGAVKHPEGMPKRTEDEKSYGSRSPIKGARADRRHSAERRSTAGESFLESPYRTGENWYISSVTDASARNKADCSRATSSRNMAITWCAIRDFDQADRQEQCGDTVTIRSDAKAAARQTDHVREWE